MQDRTMDTLILDGVAMGRRAARLGLLRQEVAEKAGVSRATACNAFKGRPVGVKSARLLATALKVPLSQIIAEECEAVAS